MKTIFAFDDVLITPTWATVNSRKDEKLNPYVKYNNIEVLPIITSPMDSIYTYDFAKAAISRKALVTLHRFMDPLVQLDEYNKFSAKEKSYVISVIGLRDVFRFLKLYEAGCRDFLIDIAHGGQDSLVNFYNQLKSDFNDANIMVGNFATRWQVDEFNSKLSVGLPNHYRMSIGGGSACQTRITTGCGWPTLGSILDARGTQGLIADGGIKNPGDMCKALVAGAQFVMMGGVFAGCTETPDFITWSDDDGNIEHISTYLEEKRISELKEQHPDSPFYPHKMYRGSASASSYKYQGKEGISSEGASWEPKSKGSVIDVLDHFEGGLRSCMTYVGATTIYDLVKAELVQVTNAGMLENDAHGRNK